MVNEVAGAMRIDVHAHYYPTRYLDLLERRAIRTDVQRNLLAGDEPHELEARLRMMDRAGVRMQVLSASPQLPYFDREADAAEAARLINDMYADLVARHPERFAAFAAIPLPYVDAALRETERALDRLRMAGVAVLTSVLGRSAFDAGFEPFYAELDRRGAALYSHPAGVGLCSPLIEDYALTWPIGAPFEDTTFALHAILRKIPARFPRLKIIVSHVGGALPMMLERLDDHVPYFFPDAPEPPSVTARRMWYDTVGHGSRAAIRCACEALGADRLILGSDYPYQQGDGYARAVSYVRDGLGDEAARLVLDRNAPALLAIGG